MSTTSNGTGLGSALARLGRSGYGGAIALLVVIGIVNVTGFLGSASMRAHPITGESAHTAPGLVARASKELRTAHVGTSVHTTSVHRKPVDEVVIDAHHPSTTVRRTPVLTSHVIVIRAVRYVREVALSPSTQLVARLVAKYFPASARRTAMAIAWCESRDHPSSIGYDSDGTHDRGLFQLNDGGTEQGLLARLHERVLAVTLAFNPAWNVKAAALLYKERGWEPWSCARTIRG
jgi:hypothetical protein